LSLSPSTTTTTSASTTISAISAFSLSDGVDISLTSLFLLRSLFRARSRLFSVNLDPSAQAARGRCLVFVYLLLNQFQLFRF
jgi:hypothetical protein